MASQLPRCVTDPLGTVSSLFDAAVASPAAGAEDGDWGVRAAFREGLAQLGSRALVERVPEINAVGVEHVPTGALVRFRCMVQDMYNPEYYVGAYRDAGGRWRTTKYTEDLARGSRAGPAQSRRFPSGSDACCTACPCPARARGCGAWTARASAPPRVRPRRPARSAPPRRTRGRATRTSRWAAGDDARRRRGGSVAAARAGAGAAADSVDAARAAKALRNDETGTGEQREGGAAVYVHPGGDASSEDALNLPLGTETAPPGFPAATPCIVKMYDDEDDVKLNDVLELVGVLGIAPALAQEMLFGMSAEPFGVFATEPAAAAAANGAAPPNANADASVDFEFMDEARAHNPPTSVVPRFHVLAARRASPQSFAVAALDSGAVEDRPRARRVARSARSVAPGRWIRGGWGLRPLDGAFRGPPLVPSLARRGVEVREKLLAFLAAPLGGDALAAEYVLFALLARVHTRSDGMPIGKFGVTLLGAPDGADAGSRRGSVASALAEALAMLAPATAHLPLSIASLNARPAPPRLRHEPPAQRPAAARERHDAGAGRDGVVGRRA